MVSAWKMAEYPEVRFNADVNILTPNVEDRLPVALSKIRIKKPLICRKFLQDWRWTTKIIFPNWKGISRSHIPFWFTLCRAHLKIFIFDPMFYRRKLCSLWVGFKKVKKHKVKYHYKFMKHKLTTPRHGSKWLTLVVLPLPKNRNIICCKFATSPDNKLNT